MADAIAPLSFLVPVLIAGAVATYLEWQFPRRVQSVPLGRWLLGLMLYLLAVLLSFVLMPVLGYAVAVWNEANQTGILQRIDLPLWMKIVLTVLILDFLSYASHFVMHRINVLWRLHRVHHSDTMITASTSLLHHPLETILLNLSALFLAPVFGFSPFGVLAFSGVQYVFNVWHHTNVESFPGQYRLGAVVFTPDLHRVHHSADRAHYNANLGLVFTFWDRMFGTFIRERDLDKSIRFGLDPAEWDHPDTLVSMLADPLRK